MFLGPLDKELYFLDTGQTVTGSLSNSELQNLSSWINTYVGCEIISNNTVTQPKLDVTANQSAGTFTFDLARPIEKQVMVLYSITDNTNHTVTTREALIAPTVNGLPNASVTIPFAQSLQPGQLPTGAPNGNQLLNNTPTLAQYIGSFDKKLQSTGSSDTYTVQILGYEVQYHSTAGMTKQQAAAVTDANAWYFDGQVIGSSLVSPFDLQNENLMLNPQHDATTFQIASATLLTQAMASFGSSGREGLDLVQNQAHDWAAQNVLTASSDHRQ